MKAWLLLFLTVPSRLLFAVCLYICTCANLCGRLSQFLQTWHDVSANSFFPNHSVWTSGKEVTFITCKNRRRSFNVYRYYRGSTSESWAQLWVVLASWDRQRMKRSARVLLLPCFSALLLLTVIEARRSRHVQNVLGRGYNIITGNLLDKIDDGLRDGKIVEGVLSPAMSRGQCSEFPNGTATFVHVVGTQRQMQAYHAKFYEDAGRTDVLICRTCIKLVIIDFTTLTLLKMYADE